MEGFYVPGLGMTNIILFSISLLEFGHKATPFARESRECSGLHVQEEEMGLLSDQTAWLRPFL